ncbi:hypothetical protein GQ42DRAFT_154259 [Ramicandelaber brevisporus]|nr:hypothetical protein GQ42DRAFT_154259 [Ramicandelaber brevisporus]
MVSSDSSGSSSSSGNIVSCSEQRDEDVVISKIAEQAGVDEPTPDATDGATATESSISEIDGNSHAAVESDTAVRPSAPPPDDDDDDDDDDDGDDDDCGEIDSDSDVCDDGASISSIAKHPPPLASFPDQVFAKQDMAGAVMPLSKKVKMLENDVQWQSSAKKSSKGSTETQPSAPHEDDINDDASSTLSEYIASFTTTSASSSTSAVAAIGGNVDDVAPPPAYSVFDENPTTPIIQPLSSIIPSPVPSAIPPNPALSISTSSSTAVAAAASNTPQALLQPPLQAPTPIIPRRNQSIIVQRADGRTEEIVLPRSVRVAIDSAVDAYHLAKNYRTRLSQKWAETLAVLESRLPFRQPQSEESITHDRAAISPANLDVSSMGSSNDGDSTGDDDLISDSEVRSGRVMVPLQSTASTASAAPIAVASVAAADERQPLLPTSSTSLRQAARTASVNSNSQLEDSDWTYVPQPHQFGAGSLEAPDIVIRQNLADDYYYTPGGGGIIRHIHHHHHGGSNQRAVPICFNFFSKPRTFCHRLACLALFFGVVFISVFTFQAAKELKSPPRNLCDFIYHSNASSIHEINADTIHFEVSGTAYGDIQLKVDPNARWPYLFIGLDHTSKNVLPFTVITVEVTADGSAYYVRVHGTQRIAWQHDCLLANVVFFVPKRGIVVDKMTLQTKDGNVSMFDPALVKQQDWQQQQLEYPHRHHQQQQQQQQSRMRTFKLLNNNNSNNNGEEPSTVNGDLTFRRNMSGFESLAKYGVTVNYRQIPSNSSSTISSLSSQSSQLHRPSSKHRHPGTNYKLSSNSLTIGIGAGNADIHNVHASTLTAGLTNGHFNAKLAVDNLFKLGLDNSNADIYLSVNKLSDIPSTNPLPLPLPPSLSSPNDINSQPAAQQQQQQISANPTLHEDTDNNNGIQSNAKITIGVIDTRLNLQLADSFRGSFDVESAKGSVVVKKSETAVGRIWRDQESISMQKGWYSRERNQGLHRLRISGERSPVTVSFGG